MDLEKKIETVGILYGYHRTSRESQDKMGVCWYYIRRVPRRQSQTCSVSATRKAQHGGRRGASLKLTVLPGASKTCSACRFPQGICSTGVPGDRAHIRANRCRQKRKALAKQSRRDSLGRRGVLHNYGAGGGNRTLMGPSGGAFEPRLYGSARGHGGYRMGQAVARDSVGESKWIKDSQHFPTDLRDFRGVGAATSHQMHDSVASSETPSPERPQPGPSPPW
jgi:hypothetical protein